MWGKKLLDSFGPGKMFSPPLLPTNTLPLPVRPTPPSLPEPLPLLLYFHIRSTPPLSPQTPPPLPRPQNGRNYFKNIRNVRQENSPWLGNLCATLLLAWYSLMTFAISQVHDHLELDRIDLVNVLQCSQDPRQDSHETLAHESMLVGVCPHTSAMILSNEDHLLKDAVIPKLGFVELESVKDFWTFRKRAVRDMFERFSDPNHRNFL